MPWKKRIAEDDEQPEVSQPLVIIDFTALTFAEVDAFRAELGLEWRGPWQMRIMQALIDNRFCIVKGPRQNSGKTWCIALLMAFCICKLGMGWVIGLPTIRQGSRILADRVSGFCAQYEQTHELKRLVKNAGYMTWDNGGLLAVVSLHEGSRAGVQGFTAHGLVLDEGHEYDRVIYDAILPVLDVAAADDLSRVIVSGVGGFPNFSLIWELQQPPEDADAEDIERFELTHISVDEISAESPKLARFFAKKKRSIPDDSWRRYYLCEDFAEEGRSIFPVLPEALHGYQGAPWQMEFGIDIGRSQSYTAVVAMKVYGEAAEVVDHLTLRGIDFVQQADKICPWIQRFPYLPHNVRIGYNSFDYGLHNILLYREGFSGITTVRASDEAPHWSKTKWIQRLMVMARDGKLAVKDPLLRKKLLALQYSQNETGVYDWPTDDVFAAMWIWQARAAGAYGV